MSTYKSYFGNIGVEFLSKFRTIISFELHSDGSRLLIRDPDNLGVPITVYSNKNGHGLIAGKYYYRDIDIIHDLNIVNKIIERSVEYGAIEEWKKTSRKRALVSYCMYDENGEKSDVFEIDGFFCVNSGEPFVDGNCEYFPYKSTPRVTDA